MAQVPCLMRVSQSPLKNAVLGSLIRTLLIQVQKTKVSTVLCRNLMPTDPRHRRTSRSPCSRSTTSSARNNSHSPLSVSRRPCSSCTASEAGSDVFGMARIGERHGGWRMSGVLGELGCLMMRYAS